MIRRLLPATVLLFACHQTHTIELAYHSTDAGTASPADGTDLLVTGTITAGLAVALDVTSTPTSVIDVTSTNASVLEVLQTTTGPYLVIAHQVGSATLDFTADGEVARTMVVTVTPP